jgi:hypothetical protein
MTRSCRTCRRDCEFAGTDHPECIEWEDRIVADPGAALIAEGRRQMTGYVDWTTPAGVMRTPTMPDFEDILAQARAAVFGDSDTWRVFIAGPLSSPDCTIYLANVHRFIAADRELRRHGFAPFDPGLDLLVGIAHGDMDYDDYALPNLAWVPVCHAVLLLGSSPGADREVAVAVRHGIPVAHSIEMLLQLREGE